MDTERIYKSQERALNWAIRQVEENAKEHSHKEPAMTTLIEEFAELVLSLRGKHDDPPELELVQIGGICVNMLAQIKRGRRDHINNIKSKQVSDE